MAPSETLNNVIGAVGGCILAGCLAPQLIHMWRTRSARDLSYTFLVLFNIGLVLYIIYSVFVDAVVGYITVLLELALAFAMLLTKIYLDRWGPYATVGRRGRGGAAAAGLTVPAAARLDVAKFLKGGGGAPFPLVQAEDRHTAAHLLLDCRLNLDKNGDITTVIDDSEAAVSVKGNEGDGKNAGETLDAVEIGGGGGTTAQSQKSPLLRLNDFAELLEECLDDAELDVQRRQTHHFPSLKQRSGGGGGSGSGADGASNLCWVPCRDAYASAMWLPEAQTLAVDLVAAAPAAILNMDAAAQAFCRRLLERYPGSKIAASSVSRLPE